MLLTGGMSVLIMGMAPIQLTGRMPLLREMSAMKGKAKLVLLIPALAVAGVLAYLYVARQLEREPGVIGVSGNMEVTDIDLSFRIPG